MTTIQTCRYRGETLEVRIEKYRNTDITRINLVNMEGIPHMTATSFAEGFNDDRVLIKDYAENEGILKALVDAHIVEETGRYVESEYVRWPICRILGYTFDDPESKARSMAEQLGWFGQEALWAKGKGGGFWIKGFRYVSMEEAERFLKTFQWGATE